MFLWLLLQSLNKENLIQSTPVQTISMESKPIWSECEQTVSTDVIAVPLMGGMQPKRNAGEAERRDTLLLHLKQAPAQIGFSTPI